MIVVHGKVTCDLIVLAKFIGKLWHAFHICSEMNINKGAQASWSPVPWLSMAAQIRNWYVLCYVHWLHFSIVSLTMSLSCADAMHQRIEEASPPWQCSSYTAFGQLVQDYEAAVPTAAGAIDFSQIHGLRLWVNDCSCCRWH